MEAVDVSVCAAARVAEFRFHNSKPVAPTKRSESLRWKAPPVGIWKINTDGAFNSSNREGGLGFVVRDSQGHMMGGGALPVSSLFSAEYAELLAVSRAIDFALDHGLFPLMIETDAQLVQRQLENAGNPNTAFLGYIYEDLWQKLEMAGSWKVVFARRDSNRAAHSMAAYAGSLAQAAFFFSTPSFIQSVVAAESCSSVS